MISTPLREMESSKIPHRTATLAVIYERCFNCGLGRQDQYGFQPSYAHLIAVRGTDIRPIKTARQSTPMEIDESHKPNSKNGRSWGNIWKWIRFDRLLISPRLRNLTRGVRKW